MADHVAKRQEEIVAQKEEQERKKRGKTKKEVKEKEKEMAEKREAEVMKVFLEKGKIERGRELERSPIKKRGEVNDKEGSAGGKGKRREEGFGAVEAGCREMAEVSMTAATAGSSGREISSEAKKSDAVSEREYGWMSGMSERIAALEREALRGGERDREIKELGEKIERLQAENDELRNKVKQLEKQAEGGKCRARKREIEIRKGEGSGGEEWEGERESNEEEKREGRDVVVRTTGVEGGMRRELGAEGGEVEAEEIAGEEARGGKGGEEEIKKGEGGISFEGRGYLRALPDKLSRGELKFEMKERERRKRNIMVRGIRTVGGRRKEEVKELFKKYLGTDVYTGLIRAIGGGLVVEVIAMENKIEIMRRKSNLAGSGIWIEDDLTEREKQVQEWLERLGREERQMGHEVRVGYMKVRVDELWYIWSEEEGRLLDENFQGEGGQTGGAK